MLKEGIFVWVRDTWIRWKIANDVEALICTSAVADSPNYLSFHQQRCFVTENLTTISSLSPTFPAGTKLSKAIFDPTHFIANLAFVWQPKNCPVMMEARDCAYEYSAKRLYKNKFQELVLPYLIFFLKCLVEMRDTKANATELIVTDI